MTDFKNAQELLNLCERNQKPISEIMKQRECDMAEMSMPEVCARMAKALEIMRQSAFAPLKSSVPSMGGLIGGQAKMLSDNFEKKGAVCGSVLSRGITYAMAVLEVNASMGVIVAAPTAGSSGIVPGLLLSLQQSYSFSDGQMIDALFNAGAIGYLAMRNATVAGAGRGWRSRRHGRFRCRRAHGRQSHTKSGRRLHRPDQHAGAGVRPRRRAGGVPLPEPERRRRCQRPCRSRDCPCRYPPDDFL